MKLSNWAKANDIHYKTALNWYNEGKLPVAAYKTPTGSIFVENDQPIVPVESRVVLYARVSSHDQKQDLLRQMDRLRHYAAANGHKIHDEISEIASGMNSTRKKLLKLLSDGKINYIIVEHKDRLTRFGFELIQSSLKATGREIIVINETESKMDLVQDFIDVITSMCSRIYGKRSATNKTKRLVQVIKEE